MKKLCALFYLFTFLAFGAERIPWNIKAKDELGEIGYDPLTGQVTASSGATVTYGDTILTADKISANERTGEVIAEGNIAIKSKDMIWQGDDVIYNFKTGQSQAKNFKMGALPFLMAGKGMGGDQSNRVYAVAQGYITTDNYSDPAYKVKAREIVIAPGEYYEAHNATLYLGDVPVFYLPYYKRSLKGHRFIWVITPGYRSRYGAYMLNTFQYQSSEAFEASLHVDARSLRGLAGGPEITYDAGRFGKGNIFYYYADDDEPGKDFKGKPIDNDRDRFRFEHLANLTTNLTLRASVNYQSDPFILRDFFESEFRENVQPKTFVEANQLWRNWTLDALVQPQVNEFFETVQRLPDVKLTGLRQQLWETPLYYDSETSFGYFERRFASSAPLQPNYAAARGDTFHQILYPMTFFGWLNFTPRVGDRVTYYSEANGRGATTDEHVRNVFNTGAETTFKASRIWEGAESKLFDVHGLRHIVEPGINYVFVPDPNVRPRQLPQFDYELPSLRLLPIDFPDYNAIDSIDTRNVLRFQLRNKLQTKRQNTSQSSFFHTEEDNYVQPEEEQEFSLLPEDLVDWNMFVDWRLDRQTNQTTLSDFFSDLRLRPRSWLTISSETRTDIEHLRLHEADHHITIMPTNRWALTIGHRYLDDPQIKPGHNLIYEHFDYRLNENWSWSMGHYYEAGLGILQIQQYTIYRDLRSWTAALTFRVENNNGTKDDFTVALMLSLKSFPQLKFGSTGQQRFADQPHLMGY